MRLLIALPLLLAPSLALAQMDAGTSTMADGGSPDAGGCGNVTPEGTCQGDIVVYCNEDTDTVEMIDCDAEFGATAICAEIDPVYGVDCKLASGDPCVFDDGAGGFYFQFCQGNDAGCVETPEEAVCMENAGTCVDADIRTCRGNTLVYDCAFGQPWLVNCDAFLGTCEGDHCVVPGGIVCDDDSLVCEPGATCNPLGICVSNQFVDAGVDSGVPDTGAQQTGDAGTSSKEDDDGGCRCLTSQKDRGLPYLLLLVAACFILKRRGR